MRFSLTRPNEAYPAYRFISETGRYQLGMWHTLHLGMRIGLSDDGGYILDYCCGKDRGLSSLVLIMLLSILRDIDEEIPSYQLQQLFPVQYIKPINYDCSLVRLQRLAGLPISPYKRCMVCQCCHYELHLQVCPRCNHSLPSEIKRGST
jgi:hypothetical protein